MRYETRVTVRYAETGVRARLKPGMIFNYLQDAATEHCAEMGISGIDLLPRNLAWVVYRYHLHICRYPLWRQQLLIRTWRHPANNLYELRQFDVLDENGELMIRAKSAWILTRLDSRRPVRLKPNMPEHIMNGHQAPVENDLAEIPEQSAKENARSFIVRMHDLDFNQHVNNSIYAIWALESVPQATAEKCLPAEIAIQYQAEAVFGDQVTAYTQEMGEKGGRDFLHTICSNGRSGAPLTRLITRWQPAENFPGL
ncbi:MAG: thioesterase [Desulfosalsimonadaceae bacterium]